MVDKLSTLLYLGKIDIPRENYTEGNFPGVPLTDPGAPLDTQSGPVVLCTFMHFFMALH